MARIDIPFVVEKQQISQPTREKLVAGGKNYFYATFKVNDNWEGITDIKASFVRDGISKLISLTGTDDGFECQIPWEVMADKGVFCVGIFGGDRMLTGMEYVEVKQGCVTDGGEPLAPTPDWFSNIEKKVEPFVINLNEFFVGDKTCAEIIEAIKEGRDIIGVFPPMMPGSNIALRFDVEGYGDSGVTLMTSMQSILLVIECTTDNTWSIQTTQMVTDAQLENEIQSAIKTAQQGVEKTANKVIQITAESTSTQYPTAKAVYNLFNTTRYDLQTQINTLQEDIKDECERNNSQEIRLNALEQDVSNLGDVAYKVATNTANINNLTDQMDDVKDSIENLNPTPIKIIPTTLATDKKYNFGEVAELNLAFPTDANDGDVIYLTFKSGAVATNLTIDTTNTCDIEVIPETNTGYEIFGMFNGSIWIINYSEYTVSEV